MNIYIIHDNNDNDFINSNGFKIVFINIRSINKLFVETKISCLNMISISCVCAKVD